MYVSGFRVHFLFIHMFHIFESSLCNTYYAIHWRYYGKWDSKCLSFSRILTKDLRREAMMSSLLRKWIFQTINSKKVSVECYGLSTSSTACRPPDSTLCVVLSYFVNLNWRWLVDMQILSYLVQIQMTSYSQILPFLLPHRKTSFASICTFISTYLYVLRNFSTLLWTGIIYMFANSGSLMNGRKSLTQIHFSIHMTVTILPHFWKLSFNMIHT